MNFRPCTETRPISGSHNVSYQRRTLQAIRFKSLVFTDNTREVSVANTLLSFLPQACRTSLQTHAVTTRNVQEKQVVDASLHATDT